MRKQEAAMYLLSLRSIAQTLVLPFHLMDGTLLGAFRDGDFCVNDEDDIDLGFLGADYDRVSELLDPMEQLGFEAQDHFYHRGRLEGLALRRDWFHFDLFRVNKHPSRAECYNLGRSRGKVFAFVYPSHHHEFFDTVEFYGSTFLVPCDTAGLLAVRYGEDWKTPTPRPRPNYHWYNEAGKTVIRHDYDAL